MKLFLKFLSIVFPHLIWFVSIFIQIDLYVCLCFTTIIQSKKMVASKGKTKRVGCHVEQTQNIVSKRLHI